MNTRLKCGVQIHTSKMDAYRPDKENGNTFWQDALQLEMQNLSVTFHFLEDNELLQKGWTVSSGHIVLDVKIDLPRKTRWIKNDDGHKTPNPEHINFVGVVCQDIVQTILT